MSYPLPKASLLSLLSGPPDTFEGQKVPLYALFLTVLLVGIVPVVGLTTGLPVLALVGVAGLCYVTALLVTDRVFAGLCAAVFVLATFYANVPLIELPTGGEGYTSPMLDVLLVDVVVVPFAGLILWWYVSGRLSLSFGRERVAGYALAGFVGWSFLAALVANGPSRLAALFYVVAQLRYLLLFGVGVVIARRIGIHNTVYSVTIAILGQLAYAMAEILNRGSFGLTRLGDSSTGSVHLFAVGPLQFEASLYVGGFVGTSRVLVAVVLLVVPVLVAVLVRRSGPWKLGAATALVAVTFLIRVSRTDTGWMAFLLTVLVTAVTLCALWVTTGTTDHTTRTGAFDYASGVGGALGSAALSGFLFAQRDVSRDGVDGSAGTVGASSAGTVGASSAGAPASGSSLVVRAINSVPFIETANLSIRLRQYVAAVDIGLHYPLFGIGGMNFPLVAESYGLPRPIGIHNVYLSVLAGTGIPGLVFFLVAIGAVFVVAARTALSPANDRLLWAMLACGMLGFYAYLFWVTVYSGVPALVFWVLAGAVVGASRQQHRTGSAGRPNAATA